MTATGEPTFGTLISDRRRWLFETLPEASAAYHYDLFTKESQQRLARRLGLATAETYRSGATLEEALAFVEQRGLERFVLKPNSSSSAVGFCPLVREGDRFRNVKDGTTPRLEDLRRELDRTMEHRGFADEWFVEELLLPPDGSLAPLEDYKFYCFGGRTEFVAHIWWASRRPRKRWACYTRAWEPVEVLTGRPNVSPAPLSERRQALLETAEAAAAALAYPFVRIDLYDTERGVVFGEFTPGPGRRYAFLPAWEERLRRRWHEAASALEEGIRSGRVRPMMPEEPTGDPT